LTFWLEYIEQKYNIRGMNVKKDNTYIYALLILGLTSLVFQVLYLRELVMVFYGNEMFIGISLSLWLLGTGIGSLVLGRLARDAKLIAQYLLLFSPPIFIASLMVIRLGRVALGSSGVLPPPLSVFFATALAIMPVAILFGLLFVVFTKLSQGKNFKTLSRAYIIESIGIFGAYQVVIQSARRVALFYFIQTKIQRTLRRNEHDTIVTRYINMGKIFFQRLVHALEQFAILVG